MNRFLHLANILVLGTLLPNEALTLNASPVSMKIVSDAEKRFNVLTPMEPLKEPRMARNALKLRNLINLNINVITKYLGFWFWCWNLLFSFNFAFQGMPLKAEEPLKYRTSVQYLVHLMLEEGRTDSEIASALYIYIYIFPHKFVSSDWCYRNTTSNCYRPLLLKI